MSMTWYNWVYYLPITHPIVFWGITILLLVIFLLNRLDAATDYIVTTHHTISGLGGFLADLFFLLKNGIIIEIIIYLIFVLLHFILP